MWLKTEHKVLLTSSYLVRRRVKHFSFWEDDRSLVCFRPALRFTLAVPDNILMLTYSPFYFRIQDRITLVFIEL